MMRGLGRARLGQQFSTNVNRTAIWSVAYATHCLLGYSSTLTRIDLAESPISLPLHPLPIVSPILRAHGRHAFCTNERTCSIATGDRAENAGTRFVWWLSDTEERRTERTVALKLDAVSASVGFNHDLASAAGPFLAAQH
jgi:hypothetical protein